MEPRYPYVHADVAPDDVDDVSQRLWSLGAQGVEERDSTTMAKSDANGTRVLLVASFADDKSAKAAARALDRRFRPRVEHVVGDAWREGWRAYFKPTRLGRRLVVRPSWEPWDAKKRDVVLTIDPGQAFGTGTHETTRLVLRELDARVRGGERVLDVGCGSGILAIGALLLGAKSARAVDVEEASVAATRENAELNGVASRVRVSDDPIEKVRGRYDLVVANIEARVLIPLAKAIQRRVEPSGLLVLSGILRGQEKDVLAAYAPFARVKIPRDGEWVAIVLRAPRAKAKR